MCMALAKTLHAPLVPETIEAEISPHTTPTMLTSDTFTQQADVVANKTNDRE